ncbi:MAG: hypothetical protein SFW62_07125 [Alphaproteobacteria bacterium]|nr:hypothetical protein [Alphaproteobacteria bacterium]
MFPLAPAYPNEDAFYCRFFTEVGSYLDAANRRLHEVDFRAEENEEAFSVCPFHDTRRGFLMNKAALTQITGEWPSVIEGIQFYTSLFGVKSEQGLNLARAWRISLASMFAPLYLYKRSTAPYANGSLPTPVSGVFKIMLDVPTTMDLMFMQGHNTGIASATDKTMPQQIQAFADDNLILLNGEYACAGSPGLIDNVVSILFEDRESNPDQYSHFKEYFKDSQEFLAFAYYMTNQYVMGTMYLLSTMTSMEVAYRQLRESGRYSPLVHDENEKLSAYERRRRIALEIMQDPENRESVLQQFRKLAEDGSLWGISASTVLDLSGCFERSVDFLKKVEISDARQIAELHGLYQTEIENHLIHAQRMAESSIGTHAIFPVPVRFGNPRQNPVQLLRNML